MSRFKEIDGLRTLAVLGVLWAHCWMFFGNPVLNIGGVPVNRIISFGGVGVDLFFVISGFCMYYTFERKYPVVTVAVFFNFLKSRWMRIAPVFYIAVLVYCISNYFNNVLPDFTAIIAHLFFVQTLFGLNTIAPHFWSLATEWHFYFILPFLFLFSNGRAGIYRTIFILMIVCMGCRFIQWGIIADSPISIQDFDRIYLRFIEFAWGILICKWNFTNSRMPRFLEGNTGFCIAVAIAFAGRLMNTTEVILAFKPLSVVIRVFSEPVMSLGFALIILNVIRSKSIMTVLLNSTLFQSVGKVSYSFYLWHWIISAYICYGFKNRFGSSNLTLNIAFLLSAVFTYLLALITYKLIEEKYFSRQKNAKMVQVQQRG